MSLIGGLNNQSRSDLAQPGGVVDIHISFVVKNGSTSWSFTVDDADQILKSWIVLSKPYYVTQWADVSPPEEKAA